MKFSTYLSIFLIGTCYSFLLINKIIFGITISIGLITLIFLNKEFVYQNIKIHSKRINKIELLVLFLFLSSFFFSAINSIKIERSLPVIIYLILIASFSFILYLIFSRKKDYSSLLFKIFSISFLVNSIIVSIYNYVNFDLSEFNEVIRFKGYLNIMTVLSILIFFLSKSKLNFIPLIFLIPNIIISNCNSAILGIIIGTLLCLLFLLFKIFIKKSFVRIFAIPISFFCLFLLISFFIKNLPKEFSIKNTQNFQFTIPKNLIDPHRQFIWGFSIEKIKQKPLFGYGQDTSNFIEGSQREIGSPYTGDMYFIPSHPHNFILELLIETGFFGSFYFILFVYMINYRIWKINNCNISRMYLIFFNGYFWSTSLVNFSFWLGWWQASYYLFLALIAVKMKNNQLNDSSEKEIKQN